VQHNATPLGMGGDGNWLGGGHPLRRIQLDCSSAIAAVCLPPWSCGSWCMAACVQIPLSQVSTGEGVGGIHGVQLTGWGTLPPMPKLAGLLFTAAWRQVGLAPPAPHLAVGHGG
jgi:hypothetical protein